MSEFQYYEFQAVDRMLTAKEQTAVNALSSHISVSASHAVVTYNWGDFKHDPRKVLLQYFDAMLYYANWGSQRLMFRLPRGALDQPEVAPYVLEDNITLTTHGKHDVLEINLNDEMGGGDGDFLETELAAFIQLRADLMDGDYRCLYLAWLKALELIGEAESEEWAAPVPPGLKKLTPALRAWQEFIGLSQYVVESAAATSAVFTPRQPNWGAAVTQLSRAECEAFLVRLAAGESGLAIELRQMLQKHAVKPKGGQSQAIIGPTVAQIFTEAEVLQVIAERKATAAAETARIKKLDALAPGAEQVWQEVETSLAGGKAADYDRALAALKELAALADYQKAYPAFLRRVQVLAERHSKRPAFVRRLRHQGWL